MNEDKRILNLVSEGLCPSQIATQCQLPTAEVVKQLSVAVNEGRLKRSDVLATFDKDWGFWVDGMMLFLDNPTHPRVKATMEKMGFKCDTEDLKLYLAYK